MRALVLVALIGCWHATKRGDYDTYRAVGLRPANADKATPPPDLDAHALAVGARAPAVTLRDQDGHPWSIAGAAKDHDGVVIVLYRGDWDPRDRAQLVELRAHAADFAQRKLALAAVSVDSPDTSTHLADALKLDVRLASDPGHRLIAAFGVLDDDTELAWPSIFVVERGAIAWRWIAIDPAKRVTSTEVLAAIDGLAKPAK